MEKLLIIIVLLVILGVLPILRTNFLVISYLQKYFFSIKRFWFFLSSKEGLSKFFGAHIIFYALIFLLYALSFYFFNNSLFFIISWLLVFVLFIDNILIIYKLYKSRLDIPKSSYRSISLFSISIFVQLAIFLLGYFTHHFFVAAFILLVFPYLIIALVHIILYPFFFWWKLLLKKQSKNILKNRNSMTRVGLLGNYGKSTTSHLLSTVFSQHRHLKGSSQYHHFTGILQVLRKLNDDTKYLFAEMGIHCKGDTEKFCRFIGPDVLFLTGLDKQYLANFANEETLVQEYLNFHKHIPENSKLYIHNEMLSNFSDKFLEDIQNEYVIYGENGVQLDAHCILDNNGQEQTHVFSYKNDLFKFTSKVDSKYNLSNLAGALAFYVDQGGDLEDIRDILEDLEADQELFKDYQTLSGLKILECPQDKTIRGLRSGLEYIENFTKPHFLIIDKIPGLRGRKNKASIHFDIGKKLANYNLEKIFLVNKYYAKLIRKGLIAGGFDEKRIFYHGDLAILRHLTTGTIFVKGEESSKIFRRIVLRQ